MDTQNLKAFLAVAESGSFSSAAEQLHLTQPAVSKRISLLEQQLEAPLFDRIGRHVTLTEAGRTLLPLATEILHALRDARQQIKDLQQTVSGQLRLVTSHHIGLHRLPAVLRRFAERYPQVEIDIQFMDSELACQSILAGEFDLGVVTRSTSQDERMQQECIWIDRLIFVAASDHPLSRKKTVSLEDLSRHPALLPDRRFLTTRIVADLFNARQLELKSIMSTNYLETIKALISVGYGWGVLPEIMLTDNSLERLPVTGVDLRRHLDCIHHRQRSLSHPAACFIDLLRESAAVDRFPE
ncbi:MAG: LysR family transcriptional regulator [Gammaproteobacteria bacterium]|nr:LysR family transcriptional regulator [Pseudomonadales bacterium]MCP5347557.1 LysR family transcriptional regulator [Pseudomonadales bacterium]